MKKILINTFSVIVLFGGIFTLNSNHLSARHIQDHEGPSCGDCHCDSGQTCKYLVESCECLNAEKQIKQF